ncbi:hypothetical protein M422DRAFT_272027 [Sphaerobolus stellatus SS14]|uniref:Cytochrome P450 n=1 Tax=Sphaerobolus stellatus (strain SS14) TaxID=990650 RepID=A0A0C9TCB6_SPHS4|nr:hypothetical protein M422DRAFT_272027 [Sphaerobolus stellatus SS14]
MNMVTKFRAVQLKNTRSLLLRLLDTPDAGIIDSLRSSVAGTILEVVYGYNVASADDYFLQTTERSMTTFIETVQPGKFLVETFPPLRHIPSWFSGAGFKRLAEQWRIATIEMVERPFDWANPSIVASMMQKISDQEEKLAYESEMIMKSAVAIASIGGTDTSRSAIPLFILSTAMHPSVQQKRKQKLILSSGLSVFQISVIGIHYLITILHDPTIYPDPFEFKPERFIKDGKSNHDVLDPYEVVFGHGRHVCPGRHFAKDTLFIIAASIFATFNITAPLDGDGKPQTLVYEMTDGMISSPKPFDCVIKPRSKAAAELIRDTQSTLLS